MQADRAKAQAFDKAAAEERRKNEAAANGDSMSASRFLFSSLKLAIDVERCPLQWTRTSSTSRILR